MKFQRQLLPSYILLAALLWGGLCMVTYYALGMGDGRFSDIAGFAVLGAMFVFPYPLAGLISFAMFVRLPWDASLDLKQAAVSCLVTGALAVVVSWSGLKLNGRFGPRAGWAFLILFLALGPLSIWLSFVAADCLDLTWPNGRSYCKP